MLRPALAAALAATLALAGLLSPGTAHAWWDSAWTSRTTVTVNAGAGGLALSEPVTNAVMPVRLHSGNFDFLAAKPDGSDLRVLAADDKTALPFVVERFDAVNELALLWVKLPVLATQGTGPTLHVYAGNPAAVPQEPGAVFGAPQLLVANFSEASGPATDAVAKLASAGAPPREPNGLLAGSARLDGTPLVWPAAPALAVPAGGAFSVQMWVRPDAVDTGTLLAFGPLRLGVTAGTLGASLGTTVLGTAPLPAGAWSHVALVLSGGQATLAINGAAVGTPAAVTLPSLAGAVTVGEGYRGQLDALTLSADARSPAALKLAAATQGADTGAITTQREAEGESAGEGGSTSYMGVLVGNLTVDAWVVIIILGVMFVISVWVMWTKTVAVVRTDRDNQAFLTRFREATDQAGLDVSGADALKESSLLRLYQAGVRELGKRRKAGSDTTLTNASLNAVRAVLDANLVRENHKLNSGMVLLTIAISGGPFLGLLGTVVGVMITFAAIAAAGDVNVNAIAPGIAAALLATVAGLGVAIPALFGYNWLAGRIKNISADTAIFVDEFITRAAEAHGRD